MYKTLRLAPLLLLPLFLLTSACRSSGSDVPCRCGDPIVDVEGCANADCVAGRGNPDNPNCYCGQLDMGGTK